MKPIKNKNMKKYKDYKGEEIITILNWVNITAAFKFTDEIRLKELVDLIEAFAEEQSKDYFDYRFNGGESTYKKWRKKQNQ
jgi:hypothetical protein|tara:strand:+ start:3575 stop:3817 length:243 start_codon:yes stop_codon:yes gene_type:complete